MDPRQRDVIKSTSFNAVKKHQVYDEEQSIVNNFMGAYNRQKEREAASNWRYKTDFNQQIQLINALSRKQAKYNSIGVENVAKFDYDSQKSSNKTNRVIFRKSQKVDTSTSPLRRMSELGDGEYRMVTPEPPDAFSKGKKSTQDWQQSS